MMKSNCTKKLAKQGSNKRLQGDAAESRPWRMPLARQREDFGGR